MFVNICQDVLQEVEVRGEGLGVEVVATDGNADNSTASAPSPPIPETNECGGDGRYFFIIIAGSSVTLDSESESEPKYFRFITLLEKIKKGGCVICNIQNKCKYFKVVHDQS